MVAGHERSLERIAAVAAPLGVATQVDGAAIRFVAVAYANAAPADKPSVLLVAEAVRHLEIGTTSLFELNLGATLVLLGLAVGWSATWASWLGWLAVADGVGWLAVAVLVASRGFEVSVSALAMGSTTCWGCGCSPWRWAYG